MDAVATDLYTDSQEVCVEMLFWFGAMLVGQILFADIIGSISL